MGALESKITELYGSGVQIISTRNITGGCINDTTALTLSNHEPLFMKKNKRTPKGMFEAEAIGLSNLFCPDGPRVPKPIATFEDSSSQYLLLECLTPASRGPNYWEHFGHQLARLHQQIRHDKFGFEIDNFIGATPQSNQWTGSWIVFFKEQRLLPQVKMANSYLDKSLRNRLMSFIENLDKYIEEPEGNASIIHGDLWTGNAMTGPNGEPVIIDPATYFGHREAEIAMTMLFGHFGSNFYEAYNETWPMADEWKDRMDAYNLYHMLNHVNLFGAGYLGSVSSIVQKYQ